ncbi:DNA recombination protein RmuC [hydrothermal vent metagenome]|uniref:DNA recombination protein RmuC n=1 Tax=hydrothermal vent metagenome TaxID=652676 RepID=A0A3B0XN20_9ZZZZ
MDNSLIILSVVIVSVSILAGALMIWRLSVGLNSLNASVQQAVLDKPDPAQQLQLKQISEMQHTVLARLYEQQSYQEKRMGELSSHLSDKLSKNRETFDARQLESLKAQQENLTQGMGEVRKQLSEALQQNARQLGEKVDALTRSTDERLKEISTQVDKRLNEGFEKTTATFADVVKRLALIDEAQKKITALSANVVSLQEVLADKRSRGAFGEVQLEALVRNMMPENSFSFQHVLSNNTRVDCLLLLPEAGGNIAIDSKFPLESYRKMTDIECCESQKRQAEKQFKIDIKKHIYDIANKYIIPGTTSEGAVMFIPAEAIFAEIHAHYYDLVEEAQRVRVWLVSPTTLMAVLTTARSVLKDSATRKQVHLIQEHLLALSRDFTRFQARMDNLSKHIDQASKDVSEVNISARKISSRFEKIEKVELSNAQQEAMISHAPNDSPE